jgi:hypothetical protein
VSRHRPAALARGADWRAADAADAEAATDAAKDASAVYQCVNAPYTQWPERFPPLQRGVLAAAERSGALLVVLENLYGYGPTAAKPMTEDLTEGSVLGERVFGNAWAAAGPTSSATLTCRTPTATFPTSQPAWPRSVRPVSGLAWLVHTGRLALATLRCGRA